MCRRSCKPMEYGAAEVKARVAALTDEEAAELAARIGELPAGGVDILGAVLIVFLVLLLTDILGYQGLPVHAPGEVNRVE